MNLDQQIDDPALNSFRRRNKKPSKPVAIPTATVAPTAPADTTSGEQQSTGFDNLGIAPNILKGIERLGFSIPTPIQKAAIPIGIEGRDIIAIAQTGSGKTVAFGVPMLQRLAKSTKGIGLILVPTRELAIQVDESLQAVSRSMHINTAVLIGGAPMFPQLSALRNKPRIIIATPGRLMDHIERKTIKLSHIEMFVLDEADRMLDMGFIPDIKKLVKLIPEGRQTMLFSATMPKEIEAIATSLMADPSRIEIDRSGATPADVSQEMFIVGNSDRVRLLATRLKECSGPVLVFTRTKRMATKLAIKINKLGFATAEIHSNRSLGQRRHALEGFKRGRYQILIATDIAARGIDVPGIELVVNYDMPANSEDYVHRIGRTGRAGKTGHAISFVAKDNKSAIRSLERFLKIELPISAIPKLPSEDVLAKEGELRLLRKPAFKEERPARRSSSRNGSRDGSRNSSRDGSRNSSRPSSRFGSRNSSGDDSQRESTDRSRNRSTNNERTSFRKDSDSSKPSKRPGSRRSYAKARDKAWEESKRQSSGEQSSSKPKSNRSRSKRPVSNANSAQSNESNQNNSASGTSFWSSFKKKWPGNQNSDEQGSKRKKRTKRK